MTLKQANEIIAGFNHTYCYGGTDDCVLVTKFKKTCNGDLIMVAKLIEDLTSTCRDCFCTDFNEQDYCYCQSDD